MDLFFGAAKNAPSKQQTVNIRVEERVVGKRAIPQVAKQPTRHDVRHRSQKSPTPERISPAKRAGEKLRPQADEAKRQRRLAQLHRAPKRDSIAAGMRNDRDISSRDRDIVNENRERVGSLPGSPRPRKPLVCNERKGKVPVRSPRAQPAVVPAAEIERCASVPAQTGGLRAEGEALSATADQPESDNAVATIVSSADAVKQSETLYEDYFEWDGQERRRTIELHLPASESSETFSLLMPRSYERESEPRDEYLPVNDLMATVRVVAMYLVDSEEFRHKVCGDKEHGIMRQLERARNRRQGADFVRAVETFNVLLDRERDSGRARMCFDQKSIPSELAIHVIEQIYNRVVAPTVGLLRQYKAFSNNVYGEILPTLVNELIERAGISSDSVFVDLGCGIGNVVLQVAAQTGCQASGVEIMQVPARFAKRQAREFEHRMHKYRLFHGSVQVWRGDFCESADVQRLLPRADVLLVNNYAFDSKLNQNLLQMFLDLKEGTRIISLKPFVTPDYKVSARNIYSPESILTVRRYPYWSQSVSWTDNGGEFFVQTVDRSRIKKFLAGQDMT